jgi:hypothetical protein
MRELTGRELEAVGGGWSHTPTFQWNNNQNQVGSQIAQQFSLVSLNGFTSFSFSF